MVQFFRTAASAVCKRAKVTFKDVIEVISEWLTVDYARYDYKNLNVTDVTLERLRMVLIAFFIAVCVASYYSLLNRGIFGDFIKKLYRDDAFTPEKAETLAEAGYLKNAAIRAAIRGGRVYRGILRCPGQDEHNISVERQRSAYNAKASASGGKAEPFKAAKYRFDFEKDRFYIPENEYIAAEARFVRRRGTALTAVIVTVVSFAILVLLLKYLPELVHLMDNFAGILSGN